jgi:hypothetical protein
MKLSKGHLREDRALMRILKDGLRKRDEDIQVPGDLILTRVSQIEGQRNGSLEA